LVEGSHVFSFEVVSGFGELSPRVSSDSSCHARRRETSNKRQSCNAPLFE
jgi:hypothetical protein